MRQLVVTACFCVLTCSASIAADQKMFNDRLAGSANAEKAATSDNITVQPKTLPLDPQLLESKPAELTTGMPEFKVLADRPIDIPEQIGTAELLAPRDLPIPPERPEPKQVVHRSTEEVCETVSQAAQSNNLPAPFFIRLLFQESGFDPGIVSHAGAQGIAQFMPATAASVGLENPFDPLQAIPAAARLLRNLVDKFGNLGLAAAAYNAGPGRIQNWLASKSALPNETKGYVKIITGVPAEHWKGAKQVATSKLPTRAPCQDVVVASAEPEGPVLPLSAPNRQPPHDGKAADTKHAARAKTRLAARKSPEKVAAAKKVAKVTKVAAVSKHATKVAAAEHAPKVTAKESNKAGERQRQRPERKRLASR